MKYLLTTKPAVEVIRRMRLDIVKINEPAFLKDILSVRDKNSHDWAVEYANHLLSKSNNPLSNTLSNLENITSALNDAITTSAVEPVSIGDKFKTLKATQQGERLKTRSTSSIDLPVISEVMLLGGNTFVLVLETTMEQTDTFYSLRTEPNFKDAMPFAVCREFLTHYGTLFGVNSMLALPLMSAHLIS